MPRLKNTRFCILNEVRTHSFINWIPHESDSISELVYLLKSKASSKAWRQIVRKLENKICEVIDPTESVILVPIPGSTTSYHTQYFTESIQHLTGCTSKNLLKHSKAYGPQKTKSLQERKTAQFEIFEEFTSELRGVERIILIDDIKTTGSTILGATEAIQIHFIKQFSKQIKIDAITLFSREKQILSLVDIQ